MDKQVVCGRYAHMRLSGTVKLSGHEHYLIFSMTRRVSRTRLRVLIAVLYVYNAEGERNIRFICIPATLNQKKEEMNLMIKEQNFLSAVPQKIPNQVHATLLQSADAVS